MISLIDGVSAVAVDFGTKTAMVDLKPGAKPLTADTVNEKFRGSQYSVKTITEVKAP